MRIGILFLKLAVIYLVIGIVLGIAMEILKNHSFSSAHAHINLVGWASMAVFGFIYILFPKAGETLLAKLHFWIYNISLPLFMLGLFFYLLGNSLLWIFLQVLPTVLALSVVLFAVNVFLNVKAENIR